MWVLRLAGVTVPVATVRLWTASEREAAERWACSVHLASTGDAVALGKPHFIP